MQRSYSAGLGGFVLLISLAFVFIPLNAQAECTAFIRAALEALAESCSAAGGSSACVHTSTAINGDGGSAAAGTVVSLTNVETFSTVNDLANETFGLSMMHVPANVPLVLSEEGLRYVLIGDVTVENLVDPASAITPSPAIPVTAIVASNLRASPSTEGTIIGSVPVGTELQAYALNSDEAWLQVLFEGGDVWVSRSIVATQGDLNTLPIADGNSRSLLQSFQLTADPATPDCVGQPPSSLLVQGPEGFRAEITVNGVDIRLDGTVVLQTEVSEAGTTRLRMSTLSGGANSNSLSLPAGFTMTIDLDAEDMASNANWTNLGPMTPNQLAFLSPLEALPSETLFAAVVMPSQEEIAQMLASINTAVAGQAQSNDATVNCDGLRPTNPLSDMANGPQTPFFWDPPTAENISGYRLAIFDDAGTTVTSVDLPALSTTFVLDTTTSAIGDGANFSWRVEALVDGSVACTSGRASVLRGADQQLIGEGSAGGAIVATPTACPWARC